MTCAPNDLAALRSALEGAGLSIESAELSLEPSSTVAIGEAWSKLAQGELDIAIAGGAEAPLSLGSMMAWSAMRALAALDPRDPSSSCKPFSKNRSGIVLGEGAAMLVMESFEHALARGAPIIGEILGYGLVTDVTHIARPSAEAQAAAMGAALRAAATRRPPSSGARA